MTCSISKGVVYKISLSSDVFSGTKQRPALALSDEDSYGDAQFAFITAAAPLAGEDCLELIERDFDGEPLPIRSYLRLERLFSINKDIVVKPLSRLTKEKMSQVLRFIIKAGIPDFFQYEHCRSNFIPGYSPVPVSGRVFGPEDIRALVDSALDFWLTTGRFNEGFEKRFASYLGVRYALTTNSGSSANLLAVSALTCKTLGDRQLKAGDEVITVAAGFPTTINPLILYGLIPVFIDVSIPTYNIRSDLIESAVGEKTRAIMIAHTLGNPFDVAEVLRIARKYDLWIIEDCCDALGSTYSLNTEPYDPKFVGTFGHIATFSFYPAHHITMGEGGAVVTNDSSLKKIMESFRDWGRDCWCPPGHDNSCKRRFDWQMGGLPLGYDHKYIYSRVGFNLKITDMQAAVGLAQMDRLSSFAEKRRRNYEYLKMRLSKFEDFLILPEPTPCSDPVWFGFPITIRHEARVYRTDLLKYLDGQKIGTRLLFGGNLVRQPYFAGQRYRLHGELATTDTIMNSSFWIGVYPGLDETMLDFVVEKIGSFFGANF